MRPRGRGLLITCIILLWLGWLACAVGEVLILGVDVESVIGSGPVVFLSGLATFVLALIGRRAFPLVLGVANCGIALLFFLLVLILDWSPRQAEEPFAVMGGIYTLLTLPLVIIATVSLRRAVRAKTQAVSH